jgi:heme/copper-type cytochrome/quinol oxidase subunit 2
MGVDFPRQGPSAKDRRPVGCWKKRLSGHRVPAVLERLRKASSYSEKAHRPIKESAWLMVIWVALLLPLLAVLVVWVGRYKSEKEKSLTPFKDNLRRVIWIVHFAQHNIPDKPL